jgi:hypothetical protein
MKRRKKLIQLEQKDSKDFRHKQWVKQNYKCAILQKEIKWEETTLDHKHKLKCEKPGKDYEGLVRGVLHFQANSLEGVIANKYKRFGLHKFISLPDFLRNMADYIENPPVPPKYIHWTEKPERQKFMKSEYNLIKKYYFQICPRAKKIPHYPKSKKVYLSSKWKRLLDQAIKLKEDK